MKLILGAAKDKGGRMSVRAHGVIVESPVLCIAIQRIFGIQVLYVESSAGFSFGWAWQKVTSAIEILMRASEVMEDAPAQNLLEILVKIRRSIAESKKSCYEEYGIERVDNPDQDYLAAVGIK